ncbi:MAG: hypothetical protein EB120_07645 [Proteobacteria bacterium]|nr:hypothetical protein [Pseudomonadota bacterium]NDG27031.1 hypothetical protein [Pseudomonadota bacterium]
MKPLFLCFFSFGCALSFAHFSLVSDLFDRLDARELAQAQSALKNKQEPGTQVDSVVVEFFLAELDYLEGRIHSAEHRLKTNLDFCEKQFHQLTKSSSLIQARASAICLLSKLGFSQKQETLSFNLTGKSIGQWIELTQKHPLPFEERIYFEGRVASRIPPEMGGSVGRALLGLESLRRMRPGLSSVNFFMAQIYQKQGNENESKKAFDRALNHAPPDHRAQLVSKGEVGGQLPSEEPSESKFYFGVIANPAGGTGLVLGRRDDRLGDTRRKLDMAIFGQSRGIVGARVSYQDEESLKPYFLSGRVLGQTEIEQFYGLGQESKLTEITEIHQNQGKAEISLKRNFQAWYVQMAIDWFYREPTKLSGEYASSVFLSEKQNSLYPSLELGWDNRESPFQPRRGTLIFARLGKGVKGMGSTHEFESYRLTLRQWFPVFRRGSVECRVTQSWVSENSPFGLLPQLSGNPVLPGVRWGRFRDGAALAGTIEAVTPIAGELRLAIFGNVGRVGESVSDLWKKSLLMGGGAALTVGSGPFQSRIEVGQFGGESIIQVGLQLSSE